MKREIFIEKIQSSKRNIQYKGQKVTKMKKHDFQKEKMAVIRGVHQLNEFDNLIQIAPTQSEKSNSKLLG